MTAKTAVLTVGGQAARRYPMDVQVGSLSPLDALIKEVSHRLANQEAVQVVWENKP